jgi:tetratricopeptide (TPR) repeat protein
MPRSVRAFLERHAMTGIPDEIGVAHRRLASPHLERGVESRLEVHHHAVRVHPAGSDDIERALATAYYYAADLREMAFRLSAAERKHAEAAGIYERIVGIDPTDAYAWEYLGLNLALAHKDDGPLPDAVRARILEAYENAIAYDRNGDNPLYHGRFLGFRARLGEDIAHEFDQKMHRYRRSPAAVGYFAESVLNGVPAGPKRRALIERWKDTLAKYERLAHFVREAA